MDRRKLSPADMGRIINKQLHMPDKLVMNFGQSVTPGHVKAWTDYMVKRAQARNRLIVKADLVTINEQGVVVVTGKNIGQAGGEVMDGVDTFNAPRPPRPKLPDPNEWGDVLVNLKGITYKASAIVASK